MPDPFSPSFPRQCVERGSAVSTHSPVSQPGGGGSKGGEGKGGRRGEGVGLEASRRVGALILGQGFLLSSLSPPFPYVIHLWKEASPSLFLLLLSSLLLSKRSCDIRKKEEEDRIEEEE